MGEGEDFGIMDAGSGAEVEGGSGVRAADGGPGDLSVGGGSGSGAGSGSTTTGV
jgi:hypothetical protein